MRIPDGTPGTDAEAFPTLFNSRIKAYGAGGMVLADQEAEKGCPRQYRMRYEGLTTEPASGPMGYGLVIHAALALMEEEPIGPEEALRRTWAPELDESYFAEAVEDLDTYLARGAPSSRFGTIATEQDLCAVLYEDEDFGPIYYGARLDWLGIDVNEPDTLHVVDYKTDRRPRARASLRGDVQLRGQDWLVRQNWSRYMTTPNPAVVVHVDLIKYYDLEWWYAESEIEEWAAWAEAVARAILRDDEGAPITGPGCGWCSVKLDCPAYLALPGTGKGVLERLTTTPLHQLLAWKGEAAETVRNLKAGMDKVDAMLAERVGIEGGELTLGGMRYSSVDRWEQSADVRAVHQVLGDHRFYDIAKVSLKALDELSRGNPNLRDALESCKRREVVGTKIKTEEVG